MCSQYPYENNGFFTAMMAFVCTLMFKGLKE